MQQTILALGALMIIMITALNHQKSVIMIQEISYIREIETAALDVAKFRIESILNDTVFDETRLGETTLPTDATTLTSTASFGLEPGETVRNDLDDYHNFTETGVQHTIGDNTYRFDISYSVAYVNSTTGDTTSTQTFAKIIMADVVSNDTVGTRVARATWSKTTIVSDDL